jgi:hypothetical protein
MSYHVIARHIMSYHDISCHVISCHIMSCHVISCYIMSYHVILCHIMCHWTFTTIIQKKSGGQDRAGSRILSDLPLLIKTLMNSLR